MDAGSAAGNEAGTESAMGTREEKLLKAVVMEAAQAIADAIAEAATRAAEPRSTTRLAVSPTPSGTDVGRGLAIQVQQARAWILKLVENGDPDGTLESEVSGAALRRWGGLQGGRVRMIIDKLIDDGELSAHGESAVLLRHTGLRLPRVMLFQEGRDLKVEVDGVIVSTVTWEAAGSGGIIAAWQALTDLASAMQYGALPRTGDGS